LIAVSPAKLERLIGNLTPGGRHPRDILARRGNEASPTHVGASRRRRNNIRALNGKPCLSGITRSHVVQGLSHAWAN